MAAQVLLRLELFAALRALEVRRVIVDGHVPVEIRFLNESSAANGTAMRTLSSVDEEVTRETECLCESPLADVAL